MVFSDDPETGLTGPREVLATWPNTDSLAEFGVGGRAGTCSLLRPDPNVFHDMGTFDEVEWYFFPSNDVDLLGPNVGPLNALQADPRFRVIIWTP